MRPKLSVVEYTNSQYKPMLHKNSWSPDTCKCVCEFEWDDELSEQDRVHIPKRIINKCEAHQDITDPVAMFETLQNENVKKNRILNDVFDNIPSVVEEVTDKNGTHKELKDGIEYKWEFDGDRNLIVALEGAHDDSVNDFNSLIEEKNDETIKLAE